MNFKCHRKIKRYKKITPHEFVVIFDNSNQLIDYVCRIKSARIVNSSLYVKDGYYQLLITANSNQGFTKNIILKDKLHIDEIKFKSRLICKCDAVSKMQKAFKVL